MSGERSRQALLAFLDYLAAKGLMAKATVAARKAAVTQVLGILPEDEASDVISLDIDHVMQRFTNLQKQKYTPGSLAAYRSRVKAAMEDFRNYLDNPLAFKPGVQPREKRPGEAKRLSVSQPSSPTQVDIARSSVVAPLTNTIIPIQIRADTTVYVQGLPYDLTEGEANKIANVVRAMSTPK